MMFWILFLHSAYFSSHQFCDLMPLIYVPPQIDQLTQTSAIAVQYSVEQPFQPAKLLQPHVRLKNVRALEILGYTGTPLLTRFSYTGDAVFSRFRSTLILSLIIPSLKRMHPIDENIFKKYAKKRTLNFHIPRFGVLVLKCSSYSAVFL